MEPTPTAASQPVVEDQLETLISGPPIDVLVVGAGVAGTYAAWRLQTGALASTGGSLPADPTQRVIGLIESGQRIGGRLESLTPPNCSLQAEFGGMGYSPHDTMVKTLVEKVWNLPAVDFVLPDAQDLIYVRGVHLRKSDLTDPNKIPYVLAADEVGKTPGALIGQAVDKVLGAGASTWTTQQWRAAAQTLHVDGRLLGDIGYWNLLLMGMSNEAFNFCTDTMGHFFEFDNWNAGQALPWLLSQSVGPYKTIATGYDQIPITAFHEFLSAGGSHATGATVTAITHNGTSFDVSGATATGGFDLTANRVVLAMPQRSLELLAPNTVVVDQLQAELASVTGRKVMKIFLTFDTPWWTQLGITKGASSTDLPMSQCWYFDAPNGQGDSLMMASYNDTLKTTFWQGLEQGTPFSNPSVAPPPSGFWADQVPSKAMVNELLRQLSEMHQVQVPEPNYAAYKDWTHDPFGGAYSTWNVGVDVQGVASIMLQPDPNLALNIVGSTYSQDQGWSEGALVTAETMLQTKVGLAPPTWLP